MSQYETDVSVELNELNQHIIHIIQDMKRGRGHDSEEDKRVFFELIRAVREKYDRIRIERDKQINEIEKILSVDIEELEKRRTEFNLEFQTYKSEILKEFKPFFAELIYIYNDQIIYPSKTQYPNEYAKLLNTPFKEIRVSLSQLGKLIQIPKRNVEQNQLKKSTLHAELKKLESIIQHIDDFAVYCEQLISNYQDVLIVMNDDNRLYQVKIQNKNLLFVGGDDWGEGIMLHQYSFVQQQIEQLSDIMDVFYETTDNYYGICSGKIMFTPKTNCEILANPTKTSLGSFIINDNIVKKILLASFPAKCMLLFEYQTWNVIGADSFIIRTHTHLSDEYPDHMNPCFSCSQDQTPKYLEYDLIIKTQRPYSDRYMNSSYYSHKSVSFENIIWNNFMNLLTLDNSFYKKRALQNFKCLFAKTDVEEMELYKDIDKALSISDDDRFIHMKLIDLFILEIKFLLIMKQLFDIKHNSNDTIQIDPTLLKKWFEYCDRNLFSRETFPEVPLQYLFNTVLSNMFHPKDYIDLLSKTSFEFAVMNQFIRKSEYLSNVDYQRYYGQLNNLSKQLVERIVKKRKGKLGGFIKYKYQRKSKKRQLKLLKKNKLSEKQKNRSKKLQNRSKK